MYRVTLDVWTDEKMQREVTLSREGVVAGKPIIYFDEFHFSCIAEDLTDAIKFLAKMERGQTPNVK